MKDNGSGILVGESAVETSAGAADEGKIIALNAAGVIDDTIANTVTISAGASSAGKRVQLNAAGEVDQTMMPSGIGADTVSVLTSEALSAGAWVNVYNNAGTANVRNADATSAGKECTGFVLSAYGSGVSATVYSSGKNTAVTGQTPGKIFLSTTAGAGSSTPPSSPGNVVQLLGIVTSASSVSFNYNPPYIL